MELMVNRLYPQEGALRCFKNTDDVTAGSSDSNHTLDENKGIKRKQIYSLLLIIATSYSETDVYYANRTQRMIKKIYIYMQCG